jgi:heat shock protein HslJ
VAGDSGSRGRLVAALVTAVVAVGCGGDAGTSGPSDAGATGDEAVAGAPTDLAGDWTLRSGTGPGGDVDGGTVEVTLTIDDERWGGTVCNSYGTTEVVVGDGTVELRDVFRTEMACLDPGVMEAEDAYLAAFTAVDAWAVADQQLTLTGDGVELVYDQVAPTPVAQLVGTVWTLEALVEGTGPDASVSTVADAPTPGRLELGEDGRFTATDGCATTGGEHEVGAGDLQLTVEGWTEQACDGLEAQTAHVREVLDAGTLEVTLEGDRLTLTADDRGLVYRADHDTAT